MSINRVNISGNLTRDAVLSQTNGTGTNVLNFPVAVNDRRKNQSTGEWEDYPNYIDCALFGNRAASLEQYLKKGTKVAVEGKLRQSSWEDKETGKKRSTISVTVDEVEFWSRNNANNSSSSSSPSNEPTANYDADDDIPF